jgi:hypothetical protein
MNAALDYVIPLAGLIFAHWGKRSIGDVSGGLKVYKLLVTDISVSDGGASHSMLIGF